MDGGVGFDVEVPQGRQAPAARPTILHEALSGQERGFPRQRLAPGELIWQRGVELFDPVWFAIRSDAATAEGFAWRAYRRRRRSCHRRRDRRDHKESARG